MLFRSNNAHCRSLAVENDCRVHVDQHAASTSSSTQQPRLHVVSRHALRVRSSALSTVRCCQPSHPQNPVSSVVNSSTSPPALYLLNAAGLAKPHAVQHLCADLMSNKCEVAVITETHFKSKHSDGSVSIPYTTLFSDVTERVVYRGGGMAVYVHSSLNAIASIWTASEPNHSFELLWVRVGSIFIGALYHPPGA